MPVDHILMLSLVDGNIGGLLSKLAIHQNKFPAKISGYTVCNNNNILWTIYIITLSCCSLITSSLGRVSVTVRSQDLNLI